MGVWGISLESRRGPGKASWGQRTQQNGDLLVAPGRAPVRLSSRHKQSEQAQFGRCGTAVRKPTHPSRPARDDMGVTAETVSKMCLEGHLVEAVEALEVLVGTERSISRSLFYTVLKKCVVQKDLVLGSRVHALTVRKGYESDTFLGNHILRMYASHGMLQDAIAVFEAVDEPDAFMWSSIISVHVKQGQDKQAMQLYRRLRMSSVKPDGHVFVAALQACARASNLKAGQEVHADVLNSGLDRDLFVRNALVTMYAKCGNLVEAQRVFDRPGDKDVVTWTAMIAGYTQQDMGLEALRLYSAMQEEGIAVPNSVTYKCLLQACASIGLPALKTGKQLHAQIRRQGHQLHGSTANSLVNMYAKCGSLKDAERVFVGLGQKDVVTWTAMISGYSQQGMGKEALCLYDAMEEEGIAVPNSVTFVCLLQACAIVGAPELERGKEVHVQIRERGLEGDVFVGNSLVNMYAKCGSLEDAQTVFEGLGQKDVVTWNAMMAAYSQRGMGKQALHLYSAMQKGGTAVPDSVTFVSLLQACASLGTMGLEQGKQLHVQIKEGRFGADRFVANSLVNMYAKCGSWEDAQRLFDGLDVKNAVTWNAMIGGYSQQGMGQKALRLFSAMLEEGKTEPNAITFVSLLQACASIGTPALEMGEQLHVQIKERGHDADVSVANSLVHMYAKCGSFHSAQRVFEGIAAPDSVTYVCLLKACASMGSTALEKGKHLHMQIRERGHEAEVFVASSLVNMYAKCGSLESAQRVFDGLGQKDLVTWTALISGYVQQGEGQQALRLYSAMQDGGMAVPDAVTLVCLLQACASVGTPAALEKGKQIDAQIKEQGHEADVFVANSLVNMYAKCGSLEDAQRIFDRLGQKDVVTWNAMIAGYSQQGMEQDALRLYRAMQEDSTVEPNAVTFVCVLQACANVAALHLGRQLHAQIVEEGLQADICVAGSLVNMYAKSGSMLDAQQVFDAVPEHDIVIWNTLIAGYTSQGDSKLVFHLLQTMRDDGRQPNSLTFLSVLTVCSHSGLVAKGREYFEAMTTQHGITPTEPHYTCMVDLLGRAGQLEEALHLIRTMPVQRDAAVWYTLLAACRMWCNVEVGRLAFDEAMKLDKNDATAYVLMSNIYIAARMFQSAQEVQARRKRIKAWKKPGRSFWTDTNGVVHTFLAGHGNNSRIRPRTLMPKIKHVPSSVAVADDKDHPSAPRGETWKHSLGEGGV